ncbi:MAG TPA: YoaK family protein [Polyangiales bacterium]|jgi:uncharacterized membrane protein YoaK (UPF0700 family)|nr:YoaK family protein [Polyangiales bacterium]
MFRHQGLERTPAQNGVLALYLAFVGGYVNSAGFALLGTFTSHVTGNVGRFANDLVRAQFHLAAGALEMIVAFLFGAFVASVVIESNRFDRTSYAYGVALSLEALLLALFIVASGLHIRPDSAAALLCAAMGMQNSLVTRLSGAVVRTTHLTGVVTDIGIEVARWLRWWRASNGRPDALLVGRNPAERPASAKIRLLTTIALSFTIGAIAGGAAGFAFHSTAMLLPSLAIALAASYAFKGGAKSGASIIPPARTHSHRT